MCKFFLLTRTFSEFPPPKFYWSRIFKTILKWWKVSVKVLSLDPVSRVPSLNLSRFMDSCWDWWRWNIQWRWEGWLSCMCNSLLHSKGSGFDTSFRGKFRTTWCGFPLKSGSVNSQFMFQFGFTPASRTSHIANGFNCLGNN